MLRKEVLSIVGVIVTALVLASLFITFVFQTYQVSGVSMQQTLHNGDHLLVWKLPRTWARLTGHSYVPKRGDIIILNEPAEDLSACGTDRGDQLVKRVVGLPGDRVVVANNILTIFNKQHPNGYDPDKTLQYHRQITEETTANEPIDIRLGPNQIYVAGDNRTDSCDSRVFGPVSLNQVVGKLVMRVLPLNQAEIF